MAEADFKVDEETRATCIKVFGEYVQKEKAKVLPEAEKKIGKGTTVRKILQSLKVGPATISRCEASFLSKHQDKKTKTITAEAFIDKLLPDLAGTDTKKLKNWYRDMAEQLPGLRKGTDEKNAAVVDRLTDTTKYTGSHQARFDDSGRGKGLSGREDLHANDGYVTGYAKKK